MTFDIGMPGDILPERTRPETWARGRQRVNLRPVDFLTDEEADCLAIAIRATYEPGVVAVQTRFHGRDHGRQAEATLARLEGLHGRGLLGPHRRYHATDVDTVSYWFHITARGRAASVPVVHRIKGAATDGEPRRRMVAWRMPMPAIATCQACFYARSARVKQCPVCGAA